MKIIQNEVYRKLTSLSEFWVDTTSFTSLGDFSMMVVAYTTLSVPLLLISNYGGASITLHLSNKTVLTSMLVIIFRKHKQGYRQVGISKGKLLWNISFKQYHVVKLLTLSRKYDIKLYEEIKGISTNLRNI